MARNVVCISRTLGAGGEDVARAVASELGFRYVDDEILQRAAEASGVSPETVAAAEQRQPLISRILTALSTVPVMADAGVAVMPPVYPDTPAYSKLIEEVIHQVAHEGDVVIVAHGASIPLAGMAGVLRVLVTASPAVRATRVASADGKDERGARKAIDDSDRARQQYLQRFYEIAQELPTHFDLTINTDSLSPAEAASLVVAAAR